MVRIEKALWEQLVNTKMFSRQRVVAAPRKWYNENRTEWFTVAQHNAFNTGISGIILRALDPLLAKFSYRWKLDIAHQRGLTLEDTLLFKDREIRRCYFFETIARQKYNIFLDFKDISWKNTNCFARCITHFSNIFIFEKKFHINLSKNKPLNSLKFMGLAFEHCLFLQLVCTLTLFYSLRREELDTTRSRELLEDSTFPSGSEKKQRKDNLLRLLITLLIGRTLSIKTT